MANVEEVRNRLAGARAIIEPYSSMGELVTKTVEEIRRIEELVKEPNRDNSAKALEILGEIEARVGPYGSYVPELVINLSYVKDELKKIL